ncbi:MAG: endonuclease/exonuclease/phosphatase family protein [Nanoarchaeota archaeon]|nr:endonuclease/exonuclease/phosphatase family protein [Nanoarchaeota archaeon]
MKILNANMWLLPFRISKHNNKRIKRIIEIIRKEEPDIVTLQEVWEAKHIWFMEQVLGYHCSSFAKRFNPTGLVTFSRSKPSSAQVFYYTRPEKSNLVEGLVKKGALCTEIEVEGKSIYIYNTHLYCAFSRKEFWVTIKQFNELKAFSKQPCIVCGDLNLTLDMFEEENNGFYNRAEDIDVTFSEKNPYKKWWDPNKPKDRKLDYILSHGMDVSFKSRKIDETISDHDGIVSEVMIG